MLEEHHLATKREEEAARAAKAAPPGVSESQASGSTCKAGDAATSSTCKDEIINISSDDEE